MRTFSLKMEQTWDAGAHVENILGIESGGDYAVACWEAGQVSPFHCHPVATEIYFCFQGGGTMRTTDQAVPMAPGTFVVHPPGELHEYENGSQRTLLFRVRYGLNMSARIIGWRGHPELEQTAQDIQYFADHPPGVIFNPDSPSS